MKALLPSRRCRHAGAGEPPEQERVGVATLCGYAGYYAGAEPDAGVHAVRCQPEEFKTLGAITPTGPRVWKTRRGRDGRAS